jgi:hypothetical protein
VCLSWSVKPLHIGEHFWLWSARVSLAAIVVIAIVVVHTVLPLQLHCRGSFFGFFRLRVGPRALHVAAVSPMWCDGCRVPGVVWWWYGGTAGVTG